MSESWSLEHFYHTVINVRDLDESVAFYQLLGFAVLNDRRDVEWPDYVGELFDVKGARGRGVLMNLPADPNGPMMDLIQWVEPKATFPAMPVPEGTIPRILAFRTKNVRGLREQLSEKGVRFTPKMLGPFPDLGLINSACCYDPNGNLIEFIELNPGQRHTKANEALLKKS